MVDSISEMVPVNFQTPPVSIPRSFIDINQQESMKTYKEASLTAELINVHCSPCICNTPIPCTEIKSSSKRLHQELSDIKMELSDLKLFTVDKIFVVRKKNNPTPISEDLMKSLIDKLVF